MDEVNLVINTAIGTANWIWRNITFDLPWSQNYFWGLTLVSLLVWAFELVFPWRKQQSAFRQDFWLDAFYMYFNFFIFSIVISGVWALLAHQFAKVHLSMDAFSVLEIQQLHPILQLLVFFVLLDFLQWITHRILHRVPFLWEFHKVHHSIQQMGFAGHLRYHWMENVLYKPLKTLGVMMVGGFEPEQAFIVHFFTIIIGHLNHANLNWSYGPLKYVLNNPVMHLHHHSYHLPKDKPYGINFGLTLSCWDYIFGTAHVPNRNGETRIGYPKDHTLPQSFLGQLVYGFRKPQSNNSNTGKNCKGTTP